MRVIALTTHPVKGCAGVALDRATITPTGLEHDRRFMVVGPDGTFRTQRRHPLLATVRPRLADGRLRLSTAGDGTVTITPVADGLRVPVSIFGRDHHAVDQGDEVAAWLTAVLGSPSRLVGVAPDHHRPTDGVVEGLTGWADSGSVLLLGKESIEELADRQIEEGEEPTRGDRFRANVLLAGGEPHAEDDLRRVRLGTAELAFAKRAVRCAVVTVDQQTGERDGPQPLETLATYRRDHDGGVVFGAKFSVVSSGEVAVGDEVELMSS